MTAWTVRVDLGDGTLVLEGSLDQWTDPDGPTPTLPVLESVKWKDTLEDGPWPRRQAVSQGQVVFMVAEAVDASWITPQTTVWITVTTPASVDPVAEFAGRCSDPVLTPHDQGTRVTLAVTDYLSDLGEYTAGATDYPAETNDERVDRLFDDSGIPPVDHPGLGFWTFHQDLAARPAGAESLLALLQGVFDGSLFGFLDTDGWTIFTTWDLLELRPNVSDGLLGGPGGTFPHWEANVLEAVPTTTAPLVFTDTGAEWELVADPAEVPAVVVSADQVGFDTTWSRRTDRSTDTVEVVKADGTVVRVTTNTGATPPSLVRRETALTDTTDATTLAAYLLEPAIGPADPSAWEAEAFAVYLNHTPDALVPWGLRQVVAVADVPPTRHPEGLPWYVGVVESREFVASGNDLTLEVALTAQSTTAGDDSVTWADLGLDTPASPTWNEVADQVTWDRLTNARLG